MPFKSIAMRKGKRGIVYLESKTKDFEREKGERGEMQISFY